MYRYFFYDYIQIMQDSYNIYNLSDNDFDVGRVKGFFKAFKILDVLLAKNGYLEKNSLKINQCPDSRDKIMLFNEELKLKWLSDDENDKLLIRITKEFIIELQNLYNALAEKTDSLSEGEKFVYYDFLDSLVFYAKSFNINIEKTFKNFNIPIPISLDKKTDVSKF